MKKDWGFCATRERRRSSSWPAWLWPLALIATAWLILGAMQASSQNSGSPSSSSHGILLTWNRLSEQGWKIYESQESTLKALNSRISNLERGSEEWMSLSAKLSESNRSLKEYNAQIAERMQERDQDLAAAYQEIDEKDLTIAQQNTVIAEKDNTILQLIIAVIGVSLALLAILVIIALIWYGKLKLPIKL